MNRVLAIGEASRVSGYALAGAAVQAASGAGELRAAWAGLPADVGLLILTSAAHAEQVLVNGDADAVFLGREWLRDPHFALRAAHELGAEVTWPDQYLRARWR